LPEPNANRPAHQARYGTIASETIAELDGLTLLQRLASGELPGPTMAEALNYWFHTVERGRVVFRGIPTVAFMNPLGTVHGGWYATLLDSCMGCAVHSTLPKGTGYTTVEFKINLVRALSPASGPIDAEGWVTHPGRRIALAEGRMTDAAGKLVATASTSCFIFETT
jgi:uncharacterized protein (TIGR00369 family)